MHTVNFHSMIFILTCSAMIGGCRTFPEKSTAAELSIIPEPVRVDLYGGYFGINGKTCIVVDPRTGHLGEMLQSWFSPSMGFELKITGRAPSRNCILLAVDTSLSGLGEEGYHLTVERERVMIQAPAEAGIFYGMQTLRQLLPPGIYADTIQEDMHWKVPCLDITDYPRFAWRGMHLDVCRHFMPVEFVRKYIDLLAMHKMNRFHWHLTEDQGWRIEIMQYPELSRISAWRDETLVCHAREEPRKFDGKRHGGYYTQDEIREVVAYAKERYITIVPEIEMPGHSLAALAAYPELSCTGGPFKVGTTWGVYKDVYCAGNEKTFEFLENVLTEVMELFPGEYIHLGGDECPKDRWEQCPKCRQRIRSEGLRDEHELQSYFIRRMEKFLNAHNRRIIGWDEILEGGLAPNATVMSWRGEEGGIAAARAGHDVVMAPNSHTYFDYYQADPENEPLAIGGLLPIEKVYSYDPVPGELDRQQKSHILGVQAQLWTEYIPTPAQAEYMAYPRACALAEIAWTPLDRKDYERFTAALANHLKRLDRLHVNYRRPGT
jgi:hexosaminidase